MTKPTLADKLVVAISSRALFDLTESHRIFVEQGVDATSATRSSTRTKFSSRAPRTHWRRSCCA